MTNSEIIISTLKAHGMTDNQLQQLWYAIHPLYGLSVAYESTRQAAQARALELSDEIRKFEANADDRAKAYAEMIKAAQDGDSLSLF